MHSWEIQFENNPLDVPRAFFVGLAWNVSTLSRKVVIKYIYFHSGLQPIEPKLKKTSPQYLTLNKPGWVHFKVVSDPRAKLFWSKTRPWPDGEKLPSLEFVPFSNGSLYVRNAKKSYEDSYYCTAVNSGGYDFEDVDVKVGGKNTQCNKRPFPSLLCLCFKTSLNAKPFIWKLDSERSLFSLKIREKERKTIIRANVTVSVTWERRCREPLVAWSPSAHATSGSRHHSSHVALTVTFARLLLLRSFP